MKHPNFYNCKESKATQGQFGVAVVKRNCVNRVFINRDYRQSKSKYDNFMCLANIISNVILNYKMSKIAIKCIIYLNKKVFT